MRCVRVTPTFMMTVALAVAATGLAAGASSTTDWPHLRGPSYDGRTSAPGLFDKGIALEAVFKVPIGSGYSGIAVSGGKAVTAYADGDADWVVAHDAATGRELWRQRLSDLTLGTNGAHDGPLSSPVIGADTVFALSSGGRLVALTLADGGVRWEKKLDEAFGASAPDFGFTTTPILVDGILVVQAGGSEGRSLVGLNARDGKVLWTLGDDQVAYQSPAAAELAGRKQVVAFSGRRIVGVAPDSGDVLWEHPLGEEDRAGSSLPTFMDDGRFAVNVSGDLRVYRVTGSPEGYGVEELYRTSALGGNYVPPVYHDGHLYGFRGQILTCVNAANGERVWRSREPGGDGLILVGDHLVVFGANGNAVVAEATPAGYAEVTRLQALDGSSLTWPSFADGRIYLRNLREMAAVKIARAKKVAPSRAAVEAPDSDFERWLRKVRAADDPQALVDAYFETIPRTPIVEGEAVHFVYRDADARDVGIGGSMNDTGVLPLEHVEGTDLFYRTYDLVPGARWEYRFQVDFDEWTTDPGNQRIVPAVEGPGEYSELLPASYDDRNFLAAPEVARGRMDSFDMSSEILGYDKKITVWLPPGYDEGEASYPLLVVNEGDAWRERGLMTHALENLTGDRVAPLVVAFVEPTRAWWTEAGGSRTADYADMLATELLPELEKRYRLQDGAGSRAVLGNRFYGFSAAYAALRHPEAFGAAAIQSVHTSLGTEDDMLELIEEGDPEAVRFYVDWNRFDERNVDRDWDAGKDCKTLHEALLKRGFDVEGGEQLDSWGWGGWRARLDDMLSMLFPAPSGRGG